MDYNRWRQRNTGREGSSYNPWRSYRDRDYGHGNRYSPQRGNRYGNQGRYRTSGQWEEETEGYGNRNKDRNFFERVGNKIRDTWNDVTGNDNYRNEEYRENRHRNRWSNRGMDNYRRGYERSGYGGVYDVYNQGRHYGSQRGPSMGYEGSYGNRPENIDRNEDTYDYERTYRGPGRYSHRRSEGWGGLGWNRGRENYGMSARSKHGRERDNYSWRGSSYQNRDIDNYGGENTGSNRNYDEIYESDINTGYSGGPSRGLRDSNFRNVGNYGQRNESRGRREYAMDEYDREGRGW